MDSTTIDRVAEAGYAAWRGSASVILPAWGYLRGAERHRWRLAAAGIRADDIRERCCVGLYIPDWDDAEPDYQHRWHLVASAMAQARRILAREVA